MAHSAAPPKDWRPARRGFLAVGTGLGALVAWLLGPPSAVLVARLGLGALIGGLAGYVAFVLFRTAVRRLHRALRPRMRPDRLS
jgi:uncharacterized membrane protein